MNQLRGDQTHIHINYSTQKKDPITLRKLANSNSTKTPKHNNTRPKTKRDFKSTTNMSTDQNINQKRKNKHKQNKK